MLPENYVILLRHSSKFPKEILTDYLDKCVRIPINENIRALNLSNCVAIMLFEVLRQQNFPALLNYDPFKGKDYLKEE